MIHLGFTSRKEDDVHRETVACSDAMKQNLLVSHNQTIDQDDEQKTGVRTGQCRSLDNVRWQLKLAIDDIGKQIRLVLLNREAASKKQDTLNRTCKSTCRNFMLLQCSVNPI